MLGIKEAVEKTINISSSEDFKISKWSGIQVYKSWKIHLAFRWTGITTNQEVDLNNVIKLNLTLAPEEFAELASQIQELSEELADKKNKDYDADFAKAKRAIEDKKKEEEAEAIKEKVAEIKKNLDK
tara:strand:+ start:1310 stop:1690 length:381 start_codon:yes stop_codon:yes gene_type:complete